MVQDKIAMALKDIAKIKEALKGIKKDMKVEETIDNEQYIELKAAYKDLRGQIKGMESDNEDELKKDDFYNKLRELKLKKEEELAHANKALFDSIATLPTKAVQLKIETDTGPANVQIFPEMRIYVNGREEKKKAIV